MLLLIMQFWWHRWTFVSCRFSSYIFTPDPSHSLSLCEPDFSINQVAPVWETVKSLTSYTMTSSREMRSITTGNSEVPSLSLSLFLSIFDLQPQIELICLEIPSPHDQLVEFFVEVFFMSMVTSPPHYVVHPLVKNCMFWKSTDENDWKGLLLLVLLNFILKNCFNNQF